MKAIAIVPGTANVALVERPEPTVAASDDIKLKVLAVGICGTDREEVRGGRAAAPAGSPNLVLGHEMFGQVVEVGKSVTRVKPGDYAVFTVRRGCGTCVSCAMNRPDQCSTGQYHERGIWGLDGYQCSFVVDKEQYVVHVPDELKDVGVLCEPLSVAEKAIDEAVRVQLARLPAAPATPLWLHGRRCLIAGLGPIGLLAALALRLRGADVFGIDIVGADTPRPRWLTAIGGSYLDARTVADGKLGETAGLMDLIFDATGVPSVEFNLLDALGPNGIYVLTGVPGGDRPLEVPGAEIIRRLVLNNQGMLGSVNAARDHYQMAVDDLVQARYRWGDHVNKLVSHRYPYDQFATAFDKHDVADIKVAIDWSGSSP